MTPKCNLKNVTLKIQPGYPSKHSYAVVFFRIREDIDPVTSRSQAFPGMVRLLTALRFFATGSFLDAVGELTGASEATCHRFVDLVVAALLRKTNRFIKWPTREQFAEMRKEWYDLAGELKIWTNDL